MFTRQEKQGAWVFQSHVYRLAMEKAIESKAKTALDIGCGAPEKLKGFIYPVCSICGIDRYDKSYYEDYPEMEYHQEDLESSDLRLGVTFDLIICADVIEHIRNTGNLIALIKRHSETWTDIIISTPEKLSVEASNIKENEDHKHCWEKEEFVNLLEDNGLRVIKSVLVPETGGYDSHVCFCKILT